MKSTVLAAIPFLLMLFAGSAYAQFSTQIFVTDGAVADTLVLGVAIGATNGIDGSSGEIELPPFPPAGAFGSRFISFSGVPIGQGTKRDFRGFTYAGQNVTYKIKSQPSTDGHFADSVQVTWSSGLDTLGGGYWHMSSPELDVDMTMQTSVMVSSDNPTVTISTGDKRSYTTFTYQRFQQDGNTKDGKQKGNKRDLKHFYWPNVHNVGEEVTAALGGKTLLMKVGYNDTQAVFVKKYGDLLKSASVKGVTHSPDSIWCLDYYPHSIKGKSYRGFQAPVEKNSGKLKKAITKVDPTPGKGLQSYLFAQLMTLKFNLAASAAGKTPEKLGQLLIFDGSQFQGDSIGQLALRGDSAWSCQPTGATMKEITDELEKVNKAFNRSAFTADSVDTAHCDTLAGVPWRVQIVGTKAKAATKNTLKLAGWLPLGRVTWIRPPATSGSLGLSGQRGMSSNHPVGFSVAQNYPNPFNPSTTIEFNAPSDGLATLTIYNLLGQVVSETNTEEYSAGLNSVRFDGTHLSSGVYFYRITFTGLSDGSRSVSDARRMVLLK